MANKTISFSLVLLAINGVMGCSDGYSNPAGPSTLPTQAAVAITPVAPAGLGGWLGGHTLTAVSLYGQVYEETAAGRVGVAGAAVYCELCGEDTHSWAFADANGSYRFSSDLATGGGVWLRPGAATFVGVEHDDYQDPPGTPLMFNRPGWRQVMITSDTRFDIQLDRR